MQKGKKEAQNAKKVARNTPLYTFHFSHFTPIFAYFVISVWPALEISEIFLKLKISLAQFGTQSERALGRPSPASTARLGLQCAKRLTLAAWV